MIRFLTLLAIMGSANASYKSPECIKLIENGKAMALYCYDTPWGSKTKAKALKECEKARKSSKEQCK